MSRAKRYGPALKIVVCIFVLPVQLILWPVVGIVGSIVGGAAYGFLSPVMETFQAVGEGKTNQLYHCFYVCLQFSNCVINYVCSCPPHYGDFSFTTFCRMELGAPSKGASLLWGILGMFVTTHTSRLWMTWENKVLHMQNIMRSGMLIQEVRDELHDKFLYHFSFMWFAFVVQQFISWSFFVSHQKTFQLSCRVLYLPGAVIISVLGFMVDMPVISCIALCKSPYMLFKGWHRLFHDLIGREGPFLETICVPFAGLAILLWPLAVVGAVLGSMVASIFLGAFAGVVVYQVILCSIFLYRTCLMSLACISLCIFRYFWLSPCHVDRKY